MILEPFQNQPAVILRDGDSELAISPAHGGRILSWRVGEWHVMDWPSNADWDRVSHVRGGNPVLFPFIARTFLDGVIGSWRDEKGVVRPAPRHGFAKDLPMRIVEAGQGTVTLRLDANDVTAMCYPFAFRLEVEHRITANALRITHRVENRGDSTMPWTSGHHFYFTLPAYERADWDLALPCAAWARQNYSDGSIPTENPTRASAPVSDPAWIDRFHLEPDLDAIALIHRAEGRSIRFHNPGDPADWFAVTTWTENDSSDFFCIEPWTALPDAIHNRMGLRHLAPGESATVACQVIAG